MYDEKCLELAKYFFIEIQLSIEIKRKKTEELAQYIQDEIESWLEGNDL